MKKNDVIIVGAGIFGLTVAEKVANELHKKVLVVEKRDHIGGNAYSEKDKETGIECHKYGAHILHTSDEEVWKYVNRFSEFTNYQHRVYSVHHGEVFPLPINLGTINQFFHTNYSPEEARRLVAEQAREITKKPANLQEQGISLIGRPLFEAFIMNYTAKQWQTPTEKLSPDIIKRLPVRYDYNNRYFNDTFEGLPKDGYGLFFQKMCESEKNDLDIRLGKDYFEDEELKKMTKDGMLTSFTGAIDRYFNYKFGTLNWRSIKFEKEVVKTDDFQGCAVMNYADLEQPFTRIIEFKHFHPERKNRENKTVIFREFSKTWEIGDEPYYPVRTTEDLEKLGKYKELSKKYPNVLFGGRLGEYAYYDMDKTFRSALDMFREKVVPFFN